MQQESLYQRQTMNFNKRMRFKDKEDARGYLLSKLEGVKGKFLKEDFAKLLGVKPGTFAPSCKDLIGAAFHDMLITGEVIKNQTRPVTYEVDWDVIVMGLKGKLQSEKTPVKHDTDELVIAINRFLAVKKAEMADELKEVPARLSKAEHEAEYYKRLAEQYKEKLDIVEAKNIVRF